MPRLLSGVAFLCVASLPALSQKTKDPRRPKLDSRADTNDAHAYYNFALPLLKEDPDKAADALFWATKLEPQWADAFYARRIALLLTNRGRLQNYWSGDRRTIESDAIKRIDSLFYHALTLDPFVSQVLDHTLFESIADEIARHYENNGTATASEVRYEIDREMMLTATPAEKAWFAYGEGRFADALTLYALAIQFDKKNGPLHIDRARVFYQLGKADSALAELNAGIADLRTRDKKELIYVYQSKALTEHTIGMVEMSLGHVAAAREAYGRALQEDFSYYPAHVQLAAIALTAHDTTTALSEMQLATELRDDDPSSHYFYGYALNSVGKDAEAEVQLRKAILLNDVYAPPHYVLGQVLEHAGRKADAADAYRGFLARAALTDVRRPTAAAHITALTATGSESRTEPR